MTEDLPVCRQIRKDREGALPVWRPLYEARVREQEYLDGRRYARSNELYNLDQRRRQFRGQEITNVNRHKAAKATADPRTYAAKPVDRISDPVDSEIAVSLLEWEHGSLEKCYEETVNNVVQTALDTRCGVALLHYDPDLSEFGETYWQWHDPNLVMWEPGYENPHFLGCGWLDVVRRMHMRDVERMGKIKGAGRWKIPADLRPDGQVLASRGGELNPDGSARLDSYSSGGDMLGVPAPPKDDDHIWVLFRWYKNDRTKVPTKKDAGEIPFAEQYVVCQDIEGCGYRSGTRADEDKAGLGLPEEIDPCPQCGGPLALMDRKAEEGEAFYYPQGRRLVILPLLQEGGDDELPWYDGDWPVPIARSFPIMVIKAYNRGGRPYGDSDTTRNWDAQSASDELLTMAFDRIMQHQKYYVMPQRGLYDAEGNRFEMRDDQFNVIFADSSSGVMPRIDVLEGSALDPAWPTYWQAVQTTLLSHQGISDLGLTPESSKNIAGVAIAQMNEMGEVPLEHFKRMMNLALAQAAGVHWDYIRYTYTPERLARLDIDDEEVVVALRGDEQPNFDFTISVNPPFTGLEKARSEAFTALLAVAKEVMAGQSPPEAIGIFAEINNLPASIVRKIDRLVKKAAMTAQATGVVPGPGPAQPTADPGANPFLPGGDDAGGFDDAELEAAA